jgi:predicted O-methyltransferase YrrM
MSLNGLFGIVDYFLYLFQSTNRHGVHSPFVYQFTDEVLYGKLPCSYENAAEMCRKRMVQSRRVVNKGGKPQALSKIALNDVLPAKFQRLLFRLIQDKQLGQHIVEVGCSLGIAPLYVQRGPHDFSRFFIFDKNPDLLQVCRFNLQEYQCSETIELVEYADSNDILSYLNRLTERSIDLFIVNEPMDGSAFWQLLDGIIPRLSANGCIVLNTLRASNEQLMLWQQLRNQKEITVSIDLFRMGMAFARPTQVKEHFILRY